MPLIHIEAAVADRLTAMRGPGESYSDCHPRMWNWRRATAPKPREPTERAQCQMNLTPSAPICRFSAAPSRIVAHLYLGYQQGLDKKGRREKTKYMRPSIGLSRVRTGRVLGFISWLELFQRSRKLRRA